MGGMNHETDCNEKNILRCILLLTVCSMFSAGSALTASAKVYGGRYHKTTTWSYDTETKTLVVRGSGAIDAGGYESNSVKWSRWEPKIETMKIEGNVTRIKFMFSFPGELKRLTRLEFPASLKKIDGGTFCGLKKMETIQFPDGLEEIGPDAFSDGGFKELDIPDSVKVIGEDAFFACEKLEKVRLPEGLHKLKARAFLGCIKLKNLELPDSLQMIGKWSLSDIGLKKITIPKNVEQIKQGAFSENSKLKEVTICSKKIKKWGKDIFWESNKNLVIYVPQSKYKEYKKALKKSGLKKTMKVVGKKSLD